MKLTVPVTLSIAGIATAAAISFHIDRTSLKADVETLRLDRIATEKVLTAYGNDVGVERLQQTIEALDSAPVSVTGNTLTWRGYELELTPHSLKGIWRGYSEDDEVEFFFGNNQNFDIRRVGGPWLSSELGAVFKYEDVTGAEPSQLYGIMKADGRTGRMSIGVYQLERADKMTLCGSRTFTRGRLMPRYSHTEVPTSLSGSNCSVFTRVSSE